LGLNYNGGDEWFRFSQGGLIKRGLGFHPSRDGWLKFNQRWFILMVYLLFLLGSTMHPKGSKSNKDDFTKIIYNKIWNNNNNNINNHYQ
jgi:hypothetical protein